MSLKINHNLNHLKAVHKIEETSKNLKISNDRLASGVSATPGVDGGAVLSLTERLRADIAGLNQASQNTEAAFSMIQVGESALAEVNGHIRHMRALAVKAADEATVGANARDATQMELEKALESIDHIANSVSFGNKKLFDGSAAMEANAIGDGFNFVEGIATHDHDLNKPHLVTIQQSATQNTTLGDISFAEVLDRPETIIISDNNQEAIYSVDTSKSENENLNLLQKKLRESGVNVSASIEAGALRITHNEYGSKHVFRVQSETPGLLVGGDDENTEGRIRQDIEEGALERTKTSEFLKDAALVGVDVVSGAGAAAVIVKNTPLFKGIQEDLIRASKRGFQSLKQNALQQLELLDEYDFLVPSKYALQPQAIIRLNQTQIMDYAIGQVNQKEGVNSLSLADYAAEVLSDMKPDEVIGQNSHPFSEKAQQLLRHLSSEMSKQLSSEIVDGIRILLGAEDSQRLVKPIQQGLPRLLESIFNNIGLAQIESDLPTSVSNTEVYELLQQQIPEFIDDFNVKESLENMVGILNPKAVDGGVVANDFKMSAESLDNVFINNGRNTIGFFERELAIGDGRVFTGTRDFEGIYLRYDGNVEPGEKVEGALVIKDPGLSFQVGNSANQQALFGLPSISTFQLARGIQNSSSYQSLADVDFSTAQGASDAIPLLDAANEEMVVLQGMLGSFGSALDSNVASLNTLSEKVGGAASQVGDTDHAVEITNWIENQIKLDTQSAVIAHSNISTDNVLRLLDIA